MTSLRKRHCYGCLPSGNLWLSGGRNANTLGSLGALRAPQDDSALLDVLSFLGAEDLARAACTCRALYVFCHSPELWRDAYIRSFAQSEAASVRYRGSWRDSYVAEASGSAAAHVPMSVSGVYSSSLYRRWSCGNFEGKAAWFETQSVPKRHRRDLSVAQFIDQFEARNLPVVLQGCLEDWPGLKRWQSDAYLAGACGDALLRATSPAASSAVRFTMAEYLRYCRSPPNEEAPLYLFERAFASLCPKLAADFAVPSYFSPTADNPTDLFRLFGGARRPDYRWLICGPKFSGSVFHIDPNATNAWNAAVRGRKHWILYPPGAEPPPGVMPSSDGADVVLPLGLGEWLLSFWAHHVQRRAHPDPRMRPVEVTCEEGEVIFVPHGWWHLVLNMDDVCIAITQNYASASNLKSVLRFLRDKPDQISGVRDRIEDGDEAEESRAARRVPEPWSGSAVCPENMLVELRGALEREHPTLLARVDAELAAEDEAKKSAAALKIGMLGSWEALKAKGSEGSGAPPAQTAGFAFGFAAAT